MIFTGNQPVSVDWLQYRINRSFRKFNRHLDIFIFMYERTASTGRTEKHQSDTSIKAKLSPCLMRVAGSLSGSRSVRYSRADIVYFHSLSVFCGLARPELAA